MTNGQNQTEETTPSSNENQESEEQEKVETPEGETPPEEVEAKEADAEPAEETPEGDAALAEQAKADEKRRRAGGWQRKIERLERERQVLLDQLATNRPGQQPAQGQDKPKDAAAQMEEYISNIVAQRLSAEREQEKHSRAQADFQRRTAEVRAKHSDYDEVLENAPNIGLHADTQRALLTSEHGPAIIYELAKNPAELERIASLPPLEAAREIGRLEARASVTPPPTTATKTATRPPAPPTNVSGSTSSTRSLDELSISDYKRAYRSGRR